MPRGVTLGLLGALVFATALIWYLRPLAQARDVGVPWTFTLGGAHCTRGGDEVYCTSDWPPMPTRTSMTSIQFTPRTRTLLRADRAWMLTDSAAWARLVDSVRHDFAARSGEPLPCDSTITGFPIAEAWHVGAYELHLYAAPRVPMYGVGTRTFAAAQMVPFGGGGCGPRYGRRLLSPAELGRAAEEWIAQQFGVR